MIGLINWSGHKNLGDDAMAQILLYTIDGAVNMGEKPTQADGYILGGGTLISPHTLFLNVLPNPEKTVAISLGVDDNWDGEGLDILKRLKKIYTRDYYSHVTLNKHGVDNTLSVDLLCYMSPTEIKAKSKLWVNIMYSKASPNKELKKITENAKKNLKGQKVNYFAMSPVEDLETVPEAKVYTDAQKLLNDLTSADTIVATRLHANILAWLSGCKRIYAIEYDPKIIHFFKRVQDLDQSQTRKIINEHLEEINEIFNPNAKYTSTRARRRSKELSKSK